ncbi:hypothetical protein Ae263Ps1_4645 [Pseudonocardia sp. Ae263_Ps1]|nr:hypothetical protein Ae150APs1_0690c [Pseudonocardia sp. Ae150A_Ps1]OLL87590.1 hypothetical protein Ae263Ps1_4645 [Pseudonocardia sp. Ae263_Ps1]
MLDDTPCEGRNPRRTRGSRRQDTSDDMAIAGDARDARAA